MTFGTVLLLSVLASYHGFNLDVEEPTIFQEDAGGFGQSVVQFGGSRLVVGAPLEVVAANQTGRLYDCAAATGMCQPIPLHIRPEAVNMSLGLTLAASTNGSRLLACGPTLHRVCGENSYSKGSCLLLGSRWEIIQTVPDATPECPHQEMDIVFLIDGSGSIDQNDFNQMKGFVQAVMGQFEGTDTLFALMQYSNLLKIHFTFTQFRTSPSQQSLVDPIVQLKGLTFTATGILTVVTQLFHHKNGARKSAKKILIVITDGQKYKDPLEYSDVIPQAEKAGIIRYAIGVGHAFQGPTARQELNTISSAPPQDHVFKVDNFAALGSIQKQLQEKIYAVEGTQSRASSSFQHEMSQEGFSTALTMVSRQWRKKAEVTGTQIGSYFGASLCSVDVDSDGSTDLILIGAPHYYEQTRGGQVSVCPLPRGQRVQWQCDAVLRGEQGHPWGRFGAALTVLGDVNEDKLIDVAIGAPGEQENRGAVYLFHGASESGISPSHSQRIASSQLSPRLQYFGQALSGGQDLTQDGLMDLAVGARGQVLLLRSLPVLKVGVAMRFSPVEVAKAVYRCWEEKPSALEAGDATVCLTIQKSSLDQLGDIQSSVRFDLALDPGRLTSRAIFNETKNPTLTRRKTLGLGIHCETLKLLLPDCVEDVVSPIILHLNFSLVREPIPSPQNLRPVLAVGSQDLFTASLPFEKNCGQDGLCEGDLGVTLSFSGLQTLTVGSSLELNVIVTVWNAGEDSYGTVVSLYYPAGLSHRRVSGAQKQPHQSALRLACETVPTEDEGLRSSRCSVNHPIFHEGSNGTFIVTFDVSYKATLGDRMLMRASASSENNKASSSKATFQLELPVKYAVYTMISRCPVPGLPLGPLAFLYAWQEESTKYFNFATSDEKKMKEAEHRYRVNNLSQRDLAISINFWVPVLLNGVAVWDVVMEAPSQSLPCVSERKPPQHSDFLTQISRSPMLDCSIADCLQFRCDVPSFSVQEELDFTLKGNLSFGWVRETLQKKVLVVSVAEITFDTSVYSQLPGQEAFMRAQMEMVLEEDEVYNAIPIIMGSSVGALLLLALITATLYKLGFFKRHYKEMLEDKPEDTATFSGDDFSCVAPNVPLS
ncbi:integrin alpha-D isoform X9 [Homo sapiens]|uniref:integrin alpha-D isoform X9 n=1 Tax=Homo sapiens TaxID=9606 RepID=UPI0005D04145|nr:integrin alpha-D isoform X9 [Homo sapiens]XP_054236233.1 integrin alpha-D isoform X9 [Homo sapiens]|eukprot:XP_011544144.1 integrin alpha-D isoform X8 [Homo sapiens]